MALRVDVPLFAEAAGADRTYPIIIDAEAQAEERFAAELAARAPGARVGLVTDTTVARLHLPRFSAALAARQIAVTPVVVPDGETSKSLARAEEVAEAWARGGLDRGAVAVALGGGVVGDLGGFVASIYLRGIPYVQVPTTLLAQVDSSVGGKTGVNLPSGKNLAGTFYQPLFVYADITTLQTLGARDRAAGLAEVIKHGAIADVSLLELIEGRAAAARAGDPALIAELVARSCTIKARVVAADERETSGTRALLNFGHTVGHALESASHAEPTTDPRNDPRNDPGNDQDPLRHGEAVALGMLAAARVGVALGAGDATLEARLEALFAAVGLPTDLDRRLNAEVLARVAVDKKRAHGGLGFVVVERVGSAHLERIQVAQLSDVLLGTKAR
jgi:3-dehydroquinate synthetase